MTYTLRANSKISAAPTNFRFKYTLYSDEKSLLKLHNLKEKCPLSDNPSKSFSNPSEFIYLTLKFLKIESKSLKILL